MKLGKLNKQNLKVFNTTTVLQIMIVNWALRTTTTNSRVSFIDLYMYLVFPTNFRIVSLITPYKHCNFTGTVFSYYHRAWVTCEYTRERIFFQWLLCIFPVISYVTSPYPLNNFTTGAPKPKQNKKNTDKTLKNDRVDLIKRISKSDISVGLNWILFWWALTNHSVNPVILDQNIYLGKTVETVPSIL